MTNFLNISRQALGLKGAPDASVLGELQRMIIEDSSGKPAEKISVIGEMSLIVRVLFLFIIRIH
jgi:hypothetical protein